MAVRNKLFQPIEFRSVRARNRIAVSPMCQYSATQGLGNDWHIQNLGAKAAGGAGIVFTEATHVSAIGRITQGCLGLWNDEQQALAARLAAIVAHSGAVPGMQIAHAGRKASCALPWEGGAPIPPEAPEGWQPLGPSTLPFHPDGPTPQAATADELRAVIVSFAETARRALEAGFRIIEIHAAHGYLLHSLLSPLSNDRNDSYGGDLAGRARALMETLDAVRGVWPAELPLFVRLSCTDWLEGGLTADHVTEVAKWIAARGDVDLIDCSSGGLSPAQIIPTHPGYQVPFADRIRREARIATGAVGMIRAPEHAAEIIANERADLVFVARAVLADPAWPLRAAKTLGEAVELPPQYLRSTFG